MAARRLQSLFELMQGSRSSRNYDEEEESSPARRSLREMRFVNFLRDALTSSREEPSRASRRRPAAEDSDDEEMMLRQQMMARNRPSGRYESFGGPDLDEDSFEKEWFRHRMRKRGFNDESSPERASRYAIPPMATFRLRLDRTYLDIMKLFDKKERSQFEKP
jgi:hypothetical protein